MKYNDLEFPRILKDLTDAWSLKQALEPGDYRNRLYLLFDKAIQQESKGKFSLILSLLPTRKRNWLTKVVSWSFSVSRKEKQSELIQREMRAMVFTDKTDCLLHLFEEFKTYGIAHLRKLIPELIEPQNQLDLSNKYLLLSLFSQYCLGMFETYNIHPSFARGYIGRVMILVLLEGRDVSPTEVTHEYLVEVEKYGIYGLLPLHSFLSTYGAREQGKTFHELQITFGEPKSDQVSVIPLYERQQKWRIAKMCWDHYRPTLVSLLRKIKLYREAEKKKTGTKDYEWLRKNYNEMLGALIGAHEHELAQMILAFEPTRDQLSRNSWVHPPKAVQLRNLRECFQVIQQTTRYLMQEYEVVKDVSLISETKLLILETIIFTFYDLIVGLYILDEA